MSVAIEADTHPRRWRMLALLAVAELLGMSTWFAGNAVAPALQEAWRLDANAVGWLTTAVQLGFVAGTALAAVLNLADVLPARTLFAAAAIGAAIANAGLLVADGFATAVATRAATGFFLAGVYPPAMKMAATWFRARRGLAVGTVVGALTVGKALPFLLRVLPGADMASVTLGASGAALLAALLVRARYVDGPYPFPARPFSWALAGTVARARSWRLATGGYLGHMFELYSFWTWIPVFLAASAAAAAARGDAGDAASLATGTSAAAGWLAFAAIAVGGAGCVWGGLVADRIGRERLVRFALLASGLCALLVGLTFGRAWPIGAAIVLLWGFFVIADSAQFSVLVTESVPPHAVGTALTLQTSIGFLLTAVTIQLIPPLVARVGWEWAFAALALGPVAGIVAIGRLARLRRGAVA